MTTRTLVVIVACVISAADTGAAGQLSSTATAEGVVVESVGPPWSGASKAGLRPGDVVTAWALPATEPAGTHAVASLADWAEAEAEHALRAEGVRVTISRGGALQTATLAGGAWLLGVAPRLEGDLRSEHERAASAAEWARP